jgi:hypothetical protein
MLDASFVFDRKLCGSFFLLGTVWEFPTSNFIYRKKVKKILLEYRKKQKKRIFDAWFS